ncbi:Glycosyl transferase, family 25 [Beauveria brongniartii RCEF 3172]|uniref:Glycosyl transferase, family 25 n=1 Tax=Beauveria brongniartii RCEF 3172 TaxID=1081107 RepID=A0A167HS32_9HYPO|nr:Glycosyl transferase, family 25 [Beauveria brongniartii RCEF 3172]
MLRDKTPAVLILESDAAWDVEVREVMRLLNHHFSRLLDMVQSTPLPNRSFLNRPSTSATPRSAAAAAAAAPPPPPPPAHPDDPWQSTHWDLLSLGQCWEDPAHKNVSVRYPDPHVAPGVDYWGSELGAERVVRLSGGIVCTTAYAVSQTGAAKLLLRSAVDLDNPIDLIMRRMIRAGDLVSYSVVPTVFAQWEYRDDIGMRERGANSDIQGPEGDADGDGDGDGAFNLTGWDTVKETGSVWRRKEGHPDISFKDMALEMAWPLIFGEATTLERSQYNETEGN